jgi:hypothetical protein
VAIAGSLDASTPWVRMAYNAVHSLFFHTIWASTMMFRCLGSHDRLWFGVIKVPCAVVDALRNVGVSPQTKRLLLQRFAILG